MWRNNLTDQRAEAPQIRPRPSVKSLSPCIRRKLLNRGKLASKTFATYIPPETGYTRPPNAIDTDVVDMNGLAFSRVLRGLAENRLDVSFTTVTKRQSCLGSDHRAQRGSICSTLLKTERK